MASPPVPKPQIPTTFNGPMQVIGAGLPRCATTTLKEMLENKSLLNVGPTMHMNRCLSSPMNMRLLYDALREKDTQRRRAILYKLFAGCAATADFPGHLFVEDLIEMYPEAKVVLNIRKGGAADWESSMKSTIAPFMSWQYRVACFWSIPDYWHYQCEIEWQRFCREKFGADNFWSQEVYDKHNAWVVKLCQERGREVLLWEPAMGWAPLCEYLGKKEPEIDVPRTNDRGKMEKVVSWRISLGLKLWMSKICVPVAVSVLGGYGVVKAMQL
ncbi:hypothetical protein Z517_10210 [Fonsecaea pedrosoi CBS 271.37]|uniref:NAD dependent epimerase/dehydratase n=1 Tax=Fonsecaea pedrosoi CBS 271.37 TaxID=1442368 RepID=A0A0D2GSP4_9EURO|nr:uncharacterized protein Z517_10210 [Fonsecaea pedrosoi CBS 271.37]KIW75469.1 hypothetical protein Z517_10210 [Fonsecaea pedrosoi CBS 271.37]